MSTYLVTYKLRVDMIFTVTTIPNPAPVAADEYYYVYRSEPDYDFDRPHWKYFPVTLSKDELPDIREARPLYLFNGPTGEYTPIKNIQVYL
jgi:hypothetical protein